MKANPTTILIENPLCGNTAVGRAFRLHGVQNSSRWARPVDARIAVGKDVWGSSTKVILVRDPIERFNSGATLALRSTPEQLDAAGADAAFIDMIAQARPLQSPDARALAIIAHMANGFTGVPIFLLPQTRWLTAKFDLVLATHNIAEYFNTRNICVHRLNMLANSPGITAAVLGEKTVVQFNALFADDIDYLKRLRVWSPNPEEVRLVSGSCSTCSAKQKAEVIDLMIDEEDPTHTGRAEADHVATTGTPTDEVSPARKRARRR